MNKEVESFGWLSSKDMIADMLTKEMKMSKDVNDLLLENTFRLAHSDVNNVLAIEDELRMFNIWNRKEKNEAAEDENGPREKPGE